MITPFDNSGYAKLLLMRTWPIIGICLLAYLWFWMLFALAPFLIEKAYHGDIPLLSSMLSRRGEVSLDHYLSKWEARQWNVLFSGLSVFLVMWFFTRRFFNRFVGHSTASQLGLIRIFACSILLVSVLWEDLASSALLPRGMVSGMGVMQWFYLLPGFDSFVVQETALGIFQIMTAVLLFLGVIGWKTRWVIPASAVAYLVLGGILRHYAWFYHTGLIPLYVLMVLSVTPCGDGLSVDALSSSKVEGFEKLEKKSAVYGWSRYACWIVIALPYIFAGLSKIRDGGLFWWDATNIRSKLYGPALKPMEFEWSGALYLHPFPDIVFQILGLATIFGELAFIFVLFSRWARLLVPMVAIMMHVGTFFIQNILFFDLILLLFIFPISFFLENKQRHHLLPQATGTINSWRSPLVIALLTGSLLFCWIFRVDEYPLTSMHMFSTKSMSGEKIYFKLLGHDAHGNVARFYPEEGIRAMSDSRYRGLLHRCFRKKTIPLCREFLETSMRLVNEKRDPENPIQNIEVQKWKWDFRSDASNPDFGTITKRYFLYPEPGPKEPKRGTLITPQ